MKEDSLQQQIFTWANNSYCLKHHNPRCLIFAVPNGGTRNRLEAIKLKATGLIPGVSDLIGLFPNKTVFFEIKNDLGKQSTHQLEFEASVKSLGFNYHLIRSLDEFKNAWISELTFDC